MRTGAKVFLGSALFSLGTVLLYWYVSYEPAGTALLGAMVLAPGLLAGFVALAVRGRRPPPSDRADATPSAEAPAELGEFVASSAWPALLGLGGVLVAAGLVYGVWLLLPAGGLFALALAGLARE